MPDPSPTPRPPEWQPSLEGCPDAGLESIKLIHELDTIIQKNELDLASKRHDLRRGLLEQALLQWREHRNNDRLVAEVEKLYRDVEKQLGTASKSLRAVEKQVRQLRSDTMSLRASFGRPSLAPDRLYQRRKTMLNVDLTAYGDYSKFLQDKFGVEQVKKLNEQIAQLIHHALDRIDMVPEENIFKGGGDGALLAFDQASQATAFARSFFELVQGHNDRIQGPDAQDYRLWFRMGAVEEILDYQSLGGGKHEAAGTGIAAAVRLESNGRPGELFMDDKTFASLTDSDQALFHPDAMDITGKHPSERYKVRRWVILPHAAAEAQAAGRWKPKEPPAPQPP